jgi:hypothetical protein
MKKLLITWIGTFIIGMTTIFAQQGTTETMDTTISQNRTSEPYRSDDQSDQTYEMGTDRTGNATDELQRTDDTLNERGTQDLGTGTKTELDRPATESTYPDAMRNTGPTGNPGNTGSTGANTHTGTHRFNGN